MSFSLQAHGLQHVRLPCPSPSPRVCSDSCPSSQVMLSSHVILCLQLLLLPSIFSSIRVFSSEWDLCIKWPEYWNFTFSISRSIEYSGLIFFRMDQFYLLAVQGTLKSLLQHHNSIASFLWCSTFLMVQLSHPYMTTRKTIAWIIWTFVDKMMSLLLTYCLVLSQLFSQESIIF